MDIREIIERAKGKRLVEQKGGWFYVGDEKEQIKGLVEFQEYLNSHPEFLARVMGDWGIWYDKWVFALRSFVQTPWARKRNLGLVERSDQCWLYESAINKRVARFHREGDRLFDIQRGYIRDGLENYELTQALMREREVDYAGR